MKIIGVIPARYGSSRLPGKPLADISGKPMIWWVCEQVKQASIFSEIYVATDDERIAQVCKNYDMKCLMTGTDTPNHIHRIWEVTNLVEADYYVSINGDEPLINPENIGAVKPAEIIRDKPYFGSVYRILEDPAEVLDTATVKIVLDNRNVCLYQSRTPIPFPKGSLQIRYKKAIGIECFNKLALDLFVESPMSELERIEDIDHLRFIQNGIPIVYQEIDSESISVDTPGDLEKVRMIIAKKVADAASGK